MPAVGGWRYSCLAHDPPYPWNVTAQPSLPAREGIASERGLYEDLPGSSGCDDAVERAQSRDGSRHGGGHLHLFHRAVGQRSRRAAAGIATERYLVASAAGRRKTASSAECPEEGWSSALATPSSRAESGARCRTVVRAATTVPGRVCLVARFHNIRIGARLRLALMPPPAGNRPHRSTRTGRVSRLKGRPLGSLGVRGPATMVRLCKARESLG